MWLNNDGKAGAEKRASEKERQIGDIDRALQQWRKKRGWRQRRRRWQWWQQSGGVTVCSEKDGEGTAAPGNKTVRNRQTASPGYINALTGEA